LEHWPALLSLYYLFIGTGLLVELERTEVRIAFHFMDACQSLASGLNGMLTHIWGVGLLTLQVKEVQLDQPHTAAVELQCRLEGPPHFSLESQMIKIDPGRSTQVGVGGGGLVHCRNQLTDLQICLGCFACVIEITAGQQHHSTTA